MNTIFHFCNFPTTPWHWPFEEHRHSKRHWEPIRH